MPRSIHRVIHRRVIRNHYTLNEQLFCLDYRGLHAPCGTKPSNPQRTTIFYLDGVIHEGLARSVELFVQHLRR